MLTNERYRSLVVGRGSWVVGRWSLIVDDDLFRFLVGARLSFSFVHLFILPTKCVFCNSFGMLPRSPRRYSPTTRRPGEYLPRSTPYSPSRRVGLLSNFSNSGILIFTNVFVLLGLQSMLEQLTMTFVYKLHRLMSCTGRWWSRSGWPSTTIIP